MWSLLIIFWLENKLFTEIFEHFTYGCTVVWNEIKGISMFRTERGWEDSCGISKKPPIYDHLHPHPAQSWGLDVAPPHRLGGLLASATGIWTHSSWRKQLYRQNLHADLFKSNLAQFCTSIFAGELLQQFVLQVGDVLGWFYSGAFQFLNDSSAMCLCTLNLAFFFLKVFYGLDKNCCFYSPKV